MIDDKIWLMMKVLIGDEIVFDDEFLLMMNSC